MGLFIESHIFLKDNKKMIPSFFRKISCLLFLLLGISGISFSLEEFSFPVSLIFAAKSQDSRFEFEKRESVLKSIEENYHFSRLKEMLKQAFNFLEKPEIELEFISPSCPPLESEYLQDKQFEKETIITKEEDQQKPSLKNQDNLDKYFSCYQRDDKFNERYQKKLKEEIANVIKHYNEYMPEEIRTSRNEVQSLFSCLIFRESMGWKNVSSHTGAKGVAQFTSIAIDNLKRMLSEKYESEDEIDAKIKEFQKLCEKSTSEKKDFCRENIIYLKNKKRLNERMSIMQNYWNQLPHKPKINDIDMNYVFNLSNSETIFHLSMLMIMDCQISYSQEKIQHLESISHYNFLACTGAYNMGKWGFYEHALSKIEDDGNLQKWINNLKNSTSHQKNECIQHLISIHRCTQKNTNFPMCGTQNNYCENHLPEANSCKEDEMFECHPKECP